eukprot:CAMPEP_0182606070 /NCGR_PEP_ID=MMETSP1330-20130603/980_1 /TAXON_ID=464278 /ORGANISM="Picochlorum sp., Strain RCC944" /LENGTH=189 /DNA_ID=CAMNT_0024824269 /DNA_START=115 /DNA_END=684 /DNA_ORIENTATION=-
MKQLRKLLGSRVVPFCTSAAEALPPAAAASPSHAKALGFLGAIPFIGLSSPVVDQFPVISSLTGIPESDFAKLQVSYGATILSFLGGVHWGLAMTTLTPLKFTAERYIWSVCPCLAAFPTMILPVQQAAAIQAALIGLVYMTDRSWAKRGGLPLWYMKTLRGPLSLVAGTSLVLTAISTTGGTGASGEE